jgi:hypothetical protein
MYGRSRSRARTRPARGGPRSTATALSAGSTLFLEADQGVAYDGSNRIHLWPDQSGNGWNATQATDGNKPLIVQGAWNGSRPVVRFNGSSAFFTSSLTGPGADNFTLYLLAQGTTILSAFRFQDGSGNYFIVAWGAGLVTALNTDGGTGGGVATGWTAGATTRQLITVVYQRNTVNGFRVYRNGALNAQKNSGNNAVTSSGLTMGRLFSGAEWTNADLALVAFYRGATSASAHDTATREANQAAILAKWGY